MKNKNTAPRCVSIRMGRKQKQKNYHQSGSPVAQVLPVSEISVCVLDYSRTRRVLQFRVRGGGTLAPTTRNPPRCCRACLRDPHTPCPRLIPPAGRGRGHSAGQIVPTFGQPVWWAVEIGVTSSGRRRSATRAAATAPPAVLVALKGSAAGRAEVQHLRNRLICFLRFQGEVNRVG